MNADHFTFKRAVNVCFLGLIGQLALGLLLLIASLVLDNPVGATGAYVVLLGGGAWLTLLIVFDQHRRERIEALETETLAQTGARDGSVFETNEELLVAARRLAWMHKWLVPAVSLVLALMFILLGLGRIGLWPFGPWGLGRISELLEPGNFQAPGADGWFISLGLALAIAGFIFARFVSGMAKQPVWSMLRGGAAQAAGMALIGLALAVCQFFAYTKVDGPLRYLAVILPLASIFLGVEILVNFVLTVYRPRRPGEFPRPAFDSRVLAFVAAPDRIAESFGEALNYQFGIDVTSSWFYQLLSRSLTLLILVGAAVTWLMTTIAVVGPNERGLWLRFGSLVSERPLEPGWHLKAPWPIDRVERVPTESLHHIDLASGSPTEAKAILWTKKHTEHEEYLIARPSGGREEAADLGESGTTPEVTRDVALVSVEVPLYYSVTDLLKYERLAPQAMRENLLKAVARQTLMAIIASKSVDDILGPGREKISDELQQRIQAAFDGMNGGRGAGVKVSFVGIAGAHPPIDAAPAFEAVVEAEQNRKALIQLAEKDRIQTVAAAVGELDKAGRIVAEIDRKRDMEDAHAPEAEIKAQTQKIATLLASAGGKAATLIQSAQADRWKRHMAARSLATEYKGQLVSFEASPMVYMAGKYFEALREALKTARVYITSDGAEKWIDLKDVDTGANTLLGAKPQQ